MNIDAALMAYKNLGVPNDDIATTEKSKMGGLLSRSKDYTPNQKSDEPQERIRSYVKGIRQARKQLKNG